MAGREQPLARALAAPADVPDGRAGLEEASSLQADHAYRAKHGIWLLLVFIWLAEFQPSEPFLVDFLVSKGLSTQQVTDEIFSLWFYFRLPSMFLMGVTAEYAGSSRTLLVGAIFGFVTNAMTRFCSSVVMLQVTQLTVAIAVSAHTGAFFALLFELSALTFEGYQLHVHWAKVSLLLANCTAGLLGSILRRSLSVPYTALADISLASNALALLVAVLILRRTGPLLGPSTAAPCMKWSWGVCRSLMDSFRLVGVAEWTLWSVVMHTGHVMVTTYWQALIRDKSPHRHDANGFANAASYLMGALALLGLARTAALSNARLRRLIISFSLVSSGILIGLMGWAHAAWVIYLVLVLFQVIFRISGAVATQQVGRQVRERAADSADAEAEAGEDAELGYRPRLALLLSVTEVIGSCVQSLVQMGFKHWRDPLGHIVSLSTRFETLGFGILSSGLLFALGTASYAACEPRRVSPATC